MEPGAEQAAAESASSGATPDACGPSLGSRYALNGLADEELIDKLKRRHRLAEPDAEAQSDGEEVSSAADVAAGRATSSQSAPLERAASSSHFKMDDTSPPRSPNMPRRSPDGDMEAAELHATFSSPGRCGRRSRLQHLVQQDSPASNEEAEKLCYEWQFEIMSSLPREKALALVDHLRRTEREKAQATALALRLHRANSALEQRLHMAASCSDQAVQPCGWRCMLRWACGLLLAALLVAGLALVATALMPTRDAAPGSVGAVTPIGCGGGLDACLAGSNGGLGEESTSKVAFTAVSVTTAKDACDTAAIEALQTENELMRAQLQGLWKDVRMAVEKGQDTVCWKV